MNDEKRFCSKCNWNDCDFGCTCPQNEEVYQCEMYMYYHPDEVNEFNKAMEEWANKKQGISMSLSEKIANAESSNWLCKSMADEEVIEIISEAKEKARKRIAVYDALDNLRNFDMYSPYQEDLSIVIDYIEELEQEIEDFKGGN